MSTNVNDDVNYYGLSLFPKMSILLSNEFPRFIIDNI